MVSEDDTTRKLRLRFALCCHGDDSILAALVRPTCPRSDPDLLGKPGLYGAGACAGPVRWDFRPWLLPRGRPAGPPSLLCRIVKT